MKICFAVCEYNPFHNGHLRHLEYIKSEIKPDILAVILSGNFTQRGEIAVLDKYTRAKHAILAGADVVFELPTVFATGNAEIFAKGAVKLANSFGGNHVLCFGTESGTKDSLLATADILINETKEFKAIYKKRLKSGVTTVRAKVSALEELNIENLDCELLKSPNNILGIEYTKAILHLGSRLDIHPIIRQGASYNDQTLYDGISSATAIRKAIDDKLLDMAKTSLPDFVFNDLKTPRPNCDDLIFYSVLKDDKKSLKGILDCTEGLENRIKGLIKNSSSLEELKDKLKTKRYTFARISRILLSSLLGIEEKFIRKCLNEDLYLKVLAISKDKINALSILSSLSKFPIITRKKDADKLDGIARLCFEKDVFACDLFDFVCKTKTNEYEMKII
ncbi:MAG: nucleotidyltransferase family protein [Clostridia bacterium]|nr:nucleotidyltransferase family protein [Clostridia bacterium]